MVKLKYILAVFSVAVCHTAFAQSDSSIVENIIKNVKINGQWFLGYQHFDFPAETSSLFTLKRGYITFRTNITDKLSVRFTQDITLDTEGADAGDVELRLKYCYLKVNLDDLGFITKPYLELGLAHRPWVDFEQNINKYRVQGSMFIERYRISNSADYGIMFVGLLGGEIDQEYQRNVNSDMPGKYGSISLGVYNGPGYHDFEENNNKILEGRLSLRPLPQTLPGFQAHYNFVTGKGNLPSEPDFNLNNFILSFEEEWGVLTAQYYIGKGNSSGSHVDDEGDAYRNRGYSFFGELFVPGTDVALFGRYDYFLSERDADLINRRIIGGLSWYFHEESKVVVDVDLFSPDGSADYTNNFFEVALEVVF